MADSAADSKARRAPFKKFAYRGIELEELVDLSYFELAKLFRSRMRRKFTHGLKGKHMSLINKLEKAKRETGVGEKPKVIKTHLRSMLVVPKMIGSVVGIYNGKVFNEVEIKPEMVGHYLGEFSLTYKPVKHGKPGIGATHSSRFIPLK